MYSHPLFIPHALAHPRREPARPLPSEGNCIRGLFFGVLFSVPMWALILWGVYELVS